MDYLHFLHKWHNTKLGRLSFALIDLAIAYGFICLAINSGSLWWYLLAIIFFIGSIKNLFKLIGVVLHGH